MDLQQINTIISLLILIMQVVILWQITAIKRQVARGGLQGPPGPMGPMGMAGRDGRSWDDPEE